MNFLGFFVLDKAKDTNKDELVSKGKVPGKQTILWLSWHHNDVSSSSNDIITLEFNKDA